MQTVIVVSIIILACVLMIMFRTHPLTGGCNAGLAEGLSYGAMIGTAAFGGYIMCYLIDTATQPLFFLATVLFYFTASTAYQHRLRIYSDWLRCAMDSSPLTDDRKGNPFTDKTSRIIYVSLLCLLNAAVGLFLIAGAILLITAVSPTYC